MNLDLYALSVLLHDIGKFWERSSDAPQPGSDEKQRYCLRHAESGSYTHPHAALSARFLREWQGPLGLEAGSEGWGAAHHQPDLKSREEICAALGDALSWGEPEADETRDAQTAATSPLQAAMLEPDPAPAPRAPRFFPLARLDPGEGAIRPREFASVSREDYRHHWHYFLKALDGLRAAAFSLEAWMALLEAYTARIPAASTSRQVRIAPHVNLFDHSRAAAALAVALWRSERTLDQLLALRRRIHSPLLESEPPLFTLIAGAIASLERPSRFGSPAAGTVEAAVRLQALAHEAALRLRARLELPALSMIHLESGLFILLAPPLEPAALAGSRDILEAWISGAYRRGLGLELAGVPVGMAELRGGAGASLLEALRGMDGALDGHPGRRARQDYTAVFGCLEDPGQAGECPDCGGPAADGARLCEPCRALEALGGPAPAGRAAPQDRLRGEDTRRFLGTARSFSELCTFLGDLRRAPTPPADRGSNVQQ